MFHQHTGIEETRKDGHLEQPAPHTPPPTVPVSVASSSNPSNYISIYISIYLSIYLDVYLYLSTSIYVLHPSGTRRVGPIGRALVSCAGDCGFEPMVASNQGLA